MTDGLERSDSLTMVTCRSQPLHERTLDHTLSPSIRWYSPWFGRSNGVATSPMARPRTSGRHGFVIAYEITDVTVSAPANDYGFYQGSMSNHDKVYQNVLAVLTQNHAIATSGLEGLKTVEVIERIYAQAKLEATV